jgi:chromosome segregation ATPase
MYLKLIMLFAVISVIGGGYAYHQVTVSNLETQVVQLEANNRTLKENQVQMEMAVKTAQESLAAAEANAKKSEAAMSALTTRNNELQREKDNAMKIFKDHNLTRLARAKPGMIEKRMNAKTEQVFRDLENDTKELMDSDDNDPVTPELQNTGGEELATET